MQESGRHKTRGVEKIWGRQRRPGAGRGEVGGEVRVWEVAMRVFIGIPISSQSVPFAVRALKEISATGV